MCYPALCRPPFKLCIPSLHLVAEALARLNKIRFRINDGSFRWCSASWSDRNFPSNYEISPGSVIIDVLAVGRGVAAADVVMTSDHIHCGAGVFACRTSPKNVEIRLDISATYSSGLNFCKPRSASSLSSAVAMRRVFSAADVAYSSASSVTCASSCPKGSAAGEGPLCCGRDSAAGTGGGARAVLWAAKDWLLAVVLVEAEDARENEPLAFEETDRLDCSDIVDNDGFLPMRSEMESL